MNNYKNIDFYSLMLVLVKKSLPILATAGPSPIIRIYSILIAGVFVNLYTLYIDLLNILFVVNMKGQTYLEMKCLYG